MTVQCLTEVITFGDGNRIVVAEENWLTGVKLLRLQKAASDSLDATTDLEHQYFHVVTYPKLLAAVIEGTPPTEDETILMPSAETQKWYEAVLRLNPQWFPDETPVKKGTEKKRKPRKRK